MTSINTNLIEDCEFDHDAFDKEYAVVKATCNGKYSERADFCDRIKTIEQVFSVRNSGNMKDVYILCKKSHDVRNRISDVAREMGTFGMEVSISSIPSYEISPCVILQLLLNSMVTYGLEGRVSNVTGKMLCPVDFKKYNRSDRIEEIIALEFSINNVDEDLLKLGSSLILAVNVRTLTNLRSSGKITFKNKHIDSYPRYIIEGGTLARAFDRSSDKDMFIMRKMDGKKSSIDMMNFTDKESLNKTKAATIEYVIDEFNRRFQKITKLKLHVLDMTHHNIPKTKVYDKRTIDFYKDKIIRIINRSSVPGTDEIVRRNLTSLGVRSTITKQNGLSELCIHVVNPIGTEDDRSYLRDYANTIQHITSDHIVKTDAEGETSDILNSTVLKVILKELMIKDDVKNEHIRLYDWNEIHATGDYIFGRPVLSEDGKIIEKLSWISVAEDGSLRFGMSELFTEISGIPTEIIIEMVDKDGYFAIDPNRNCVTVSHTDIIAVPSIKLTRDKLAKNSKDPFCGKTVGIRANREVLFPECTDIKYMTMDENSGIYMTGTMGSGMQSKAQHAANFRLVNLITGNTLFLDKLVDMMDVPFIRYNQTTVIPFPVKYLDEWMKMNC